jgi:Aldo/keto reductases, related to diketogulonate reductase
MAENKPPVSDECPTAAEMPMLGLGTWKNSDPAACAASVATALETGYRHIDTAQAYNNEAAVGDGIERAAVDREEVFLATKIWIDNLSYDNVLETADASLDRLGVDSVDLLYVHWPSRTYDAEDTLAAFDELYDRGKIDRVGVSNFEPAQLGEAIALSDAPIFANQIEVHPLLQQEELREVCADHGIELVAYSPLARGEVFDVPEIVEIADDHGVARLRSASRGYATMGSQRSRRRQGATTSVTTGRRCRCRYPTRRSKPSTTSKPPTGGSIPASARGTTDRTQPSHTPAGQ